jgi:hypothetical protein
MAGARATGKSVFIGVLGEELKRLAERLRADFRPADANTEENYVEIYRKRLFEERMLIPPTDTAGMGDGYQKRPLIWSFKVRGEKPWYLVVWDVAGEDLENESLDSPALAHFAGVDAVLYLVDPLSIPDVRQMLPDEVAHSGVDPAKTIAVLRTIMRILGNQPKPLGVVISKFDHMHQLRDVPVMWPRAVMSNAGAAFLRDPPPEAQLVMVDGRPAVLDPSDQILLDHEVRSLLTRLRVGEILNIVDNPAGGADIPTEFFAVSALGERSYGDRVNPRGISPFRCLDPITWALYHGWDL